MKSFLLLLFISITTIQVFTQNVGIGTNTPNGTASLELADDDKGFLPNRVALDSLKDLASITLEDGITNPTSIQMPDGLMIYNTSTASNPDILVPGYYAWDRTKNEWKPMFSSTGLNDLGVVSAFPGITLPNDMYLKLDGATYNKADYPEFTEILGNLSSEVITSTATTFTLVNWNNNGSFLRGSGGNALSIGVVQNNATSLPSTNFSTGSTNTSASGNHNHNFYTANNDVNSSSSQGYPSGNNHLSFRTTDRRQRTEDNGTIRTEGIHIHTIPSLSVNGGGDIETRPINRSITWVIKVKPSAAYVGALTLNSLTTPPDSDWYIQNSTNSSSDINDNIYTNGNIGIGVTSPQQALDVDGTIRSSALAGTGTRMVVANANGDLSAQPAGKVLNTWFASTPTTRQTISSTTPILVTGLSITLTPSSNNSKFIIMAVVNGSFQYVSSTLIYRNGAKLLTHGSNNNEPGSQVTTYHNDDVSNKMLQHIINYKDSPNTTSSITYDVRCTSAWSGGIRNTFINDRASNDMRTPSTLLIMEVAN